MGRTAALLRVPDELLAPHPELYGTDAAWRCRSLADALAASPPWRRLRGTAALVVRPDAGLIGILGEVDDADRPLVDALGGQVPDLLRRLRPVNHDAVTEAVLRLADRIRRRLPGDELRRHRIVAIPRGGFVVAGLLAAALDLPIASGDRGADGGPVILVDDCAISGLRLREALAAWRGRLTGVALLHAHPDLCRRVEATEPEIAFCLAAEDLVDHAPERADYDDWHRRWTARSPGTYWVGDPDHVCYPWNEPDALAWNEVRRAAEAGWRVVPPTWCLKNRAAAHPDDLQLCEPPRTAARVAPSLVWADLDDGVLLAGLGLGPPVMLRRSAAATWRGLVDGDLEADVERVPPLIAELARRGIVRAAR